MLRNLKVILAAALALSALGAIAASAHAADEFHCSANPCRGRFTADGTGKTAHQVFIVSNAGGTESLSFTCEKLTGEATVSAAVATEVTATNIKYPNCTVNGSSGAVLDMNSCDYLLTGAGGRTDEAELHVECPGTNKIELTVPGGCVFSIGTQRLKGIGLHTIGTSPNREVTVTTNVAGIAITANASCVGLINPNQTLIGFFTTGNEIGTGETDPGEAMADAWYE